MSNQTPEPVVGQLPKGLTQAQEAAREDMAGKVDALHHALVEAPMNDISKLPEHHFVESFLPYFCGEKKLDDAPEIMVMWNSIAGSPAKPVQIIDNAGKPLFLVPPMNDSTVFDVSNTQGAMGFDRILKEWFKLTSMLPAYGEGFLARAITPRLQALVNDSTVLNANEKKWFDIFARYGKMSPGQKATVADQVASKRVGDDELEY